MKRVLGTALGLVVVVLVVLIPAAFYDVSTGGDDVAEPTTITRYFADFDIAGDGSMAVTETLTVDFPIGGRHGIFRFWDVADPNAPSLRREPRDVAVTLDGEAEEFEQYAEDNGSLPVAKIGSAYRTIRPGEHVYTISYVVDDVLIDGTGAPESQFYWNLIPGGWRQRILEARLRVRLPSAALDVECAVGAGETGGCTADGEGTTTLDVRVGPLEPNTPVTVRTGLDIATPEVQGTSLPWSARFDPVLGTSVVLLGLVLLARSGCAGPRRGSRRPVP